MSYTPVKGFYILSMEETKHKHRVLVREKKKAVLCHDKNAADDLYVANPAVNSRILVPSQSVKSVKTDNHELVESVTHALMMILKNWN
ncbi:uncharacterized protein Bfra_002652 [Botrytis fragariae]|uniref:Uncharacterized protein n=1 Tax=Botrytis fragariae TaxID=1964551 RepID=A0A8H6AZE6_9HELO|nr:uncharacterized protein Bfra_002652 [Botrytis fragariae]KAF5876250.1 hypothetical protein Bfra_002652 [Botrytis fragariae]